MAVYSCPPNAVSYYSEGVGLMALCLTKMLNEGYEGSLNELQQELRVRLIEKLPSVFKELPKNLKEFVNKHLPVHTSTMFHDINLHQNKLQALCPNISVAMTSDNTQVTITVYSSKPLNRHQKYQLKEYVVIATPKNGTAMELLTTKASFTGKSTELPVMLPPQMAPTGGEVVVAAVYGDNGNLRVNSKPCLIEEWPCYGKPTLSCSSAYGGYAVNVNYDANALPNHYVQATELRLLHQASGDGIRLRPQDGVAILPPSLSAIKCELQLAVTYEGCAAPMLSEPCEVIQPALPKPKIVSVDKVDALTLCLKFSSNSPDISMHSDLYKVTECRVQSRCGSTEWVEVDRKQFGEGDSVDSDMVVKQHLSRTRKECDYRVILCYHCVEVTSNTFSIHIDALDAPDKVDLVEEMCSKTLISFSHSLRTESKFREQLVYKVVELNSLHEERELQGRRLTDTQGRKSMIVDDYSGGDSVYVCVFYKDSPELGVVYSDRYKGSRCHYRCCGCVKCIPKSWIVGLFVLLFCVLLCAGGVCVLSTTHFNDTRLVAADQIVAYERGIFSYLCSGVYIEEHIIDYSDNPKGLNVSIIEMAHEGITTENAYVPSTAYIGTFLKVNSGQKRKLVPDNYYTNPKYLLKDSTITLECQFYGVDPGNHIEHAHVYIFDSREDAVKYQSGNGSLKAVHVADVSGCIERACKHEFTVNKNAFYFPVLTTKANFLLNVTTNFSFNIVRYNHSYSQLDGETVTKDRRLFYHFKKSHLTLLYAHPPPFYEPKLSHLRFTCSPQKDLIANVVYAIAACFLLVVTSITLSVLICKRLYRQEGRALEEPNETTPLLSHVT